MRRGAKLSLVIVTVFFCGLAALAVLLTQWRFFSIPATSMEPTVARGDHILAHCHSFQPRRQQVVVFLNAEGLYLTKRVAAVGGDTIEIRQQHVFVNGAEVAEPYAVHTLKGPPHNEYMDNLAPQTVPAGHIFVLGDNRDLSYDSRQPEYGPVADSQLMCEVTRVAWSSDPSRFWKRVQ